jgi:hypothetical protein
VKCLAKASQTTTESYTRGRSESHVASEGLEPIYQDLPSAVHSYQNALYFAVQKLRSLAAGEAFASFVDSAGMHTAHVQVPYVKPVSVSDNTFISIRTLILSRSPSAIETPNAISRLGVALRQASDAWRCPRFRRSSRQ